MTGQLHKQAGLSLIELMIAITLSLVLTLGVIQIFSSSKQTNRTQSALGGIQENARFALDTLSYDLRMAGNIGCNRSAAVSNIKADTNLDDIGGGIQGYEYGDALPAVLLRDDTGSSSKNPNKTNDIKTIVSGTDAIVIRYASPSAIDVASATKTSVTLAAAPGDISAGEPLIISDCQNADIFIAAEIDGNTIKLADKIEFSKIYGKDAEVAPLKYSAYYIREYKDDDNIIRSNLYKSTVTKHDNIETDPLLEGVEDLQILYGEDISAAGDGSNIRYVAAGTANLDMKRVTSLRISLLFSTIDNNLTSSDQNYWFNGELLKVERADNTSKKLYRGFTTTIKLRNQGI